MYIVGRDHVASRCDAVGDGLYLGLDIDRSRSIYV